MCVCACVVVVVGRWGLLSVAIHLSSLMRSESCTNTDIDNIPPQERRSPLSTSPLPSCVMSVSLTSVRAACADPHTPADPTSKTSSTATAAAAAAETKTLSFGRCRTASNLTAWIQCGGERERKREKGKQTNEEMMLYVQFTKDIIGKL